MTKYEWLALRETLDARFRSARLAKAFMDHARKTRLIVDLGCGTSANYRYLSRDGASKVPWRCIDNDDEVLKAAAEQCVSQFVRFERADLATELSMVPIGDDVSFTASAFLDIASEDWLCWFATIAAQSPVLISMTMSGTPVWDPIDELDEAIDRCLQSHQQSDHGFGAAAGSHAAEFFAEQLTSRGCKVIFEQSGWQLGNQDSQVISALIDSIGRRASTMLARDQVDHWMAIRQTQNQNGALTMQIPHLDLLSLP
ncbi:MAG: hypothetical protein WBD31_13790 [Rubripirellula sp.]